MNKPNRLAEWRDAINHLYGSSTTNTEQKSIIDYTRMTPEEIRKHLINSLPKFNGNDPSEIEVAVRLDVVQETIDYIEWLEKGVDEWRNEANKNKLSVLGVKYVEIARETRIADLEARLRALCEAEPVCTLTVNDSGNVEGICLITEQGLLNLTPGKYDLTPRPSMEKN